MKHLLHLRNLACPVLYSSRVTDNCLRDIRRLRSLKSLDLQGSPGVSREAVLAAGLPIRAF